MYIHVCTHTYVVSGCRFASCCEGQAKHLYKYTRTHTHTHARTQTRTQTHAKYTRIRVQKTCKYAKKTSIYKINLNAIETCKYTKQNVERTEETLKCTKETFPYTKERCKYLKGLLKIQMVSFEQVCVSQGSHTHTHIQVHTHSHTEHIPAAKDEQNT